MTFKNWLENENLNAMPRGTYNLRRQRLDFNKLNRKAIKITHPGAGTSKSTEVEYNNNEWSFSIITPFNSVWQYWEIKPISEKYVLETDWLNGKQENGKPNLDDAKYRQVVMAAERLGLM